MYVYNYIYTLYIYTQHISNKDSVLCGTLPISGAHRRKKHDPQILTERCCPLVIYHSYGNSQFRIY